MSKETKEQYLNFEGMQDDMDDSMSISHAPQKHLTISNSSSRKMKRIDDSEESGQSFKELIMKESSSRLS